MAASSLAASASASASASFSDNYDGAVFMICQNIAGPHACDIYSIDFKLASQSNYGSSPLSIPNPVKRLERELYPICMGFFSIGSKIYMVGGVKIDQPTGSGKRTNCVYVYDTVTNSVSCGPSMLKPKVAPFVLGSDHGGNIYVHGANLRDHDFELFDPQLEKWIRLPNAPVPSMKDSNHKARGPPPQYNIAASAVVGDIILLWTFNCHVFSFNIITRTWTMDKGGKPPFAGQAVRVGRHFYVPVDKGRSEFPLCAFHFEPPYNLVEEAPVKNLPHPAEISTESRGYVTYLGNQHFCVVRSGYDGNPYSYEYIPPKHSVTIDLFKVESQCIRCDDVKSSCFLAVDHRSLSYIIDDDHPEDTARMIYFATPILRPAVTRG